MSREKEHKINLDGTGAFLYIPTMTTMGAKMKRTTKHGQQYMKDESIARRRIWKAQRRKALRANDRRAVREQN